MLCNINTLAKYTKVQMHLIFMNLILLDLLNKNLITLNQSANYRKILKILIDAKLRTYTDFLQSHSRLRVVMETNKLVSQISNGAKTYYCLLVWPLGGIVVAPIKKNKCVESLILMQI